MFHLIRCALLLGLTLLVLMPDLGAEEPEILSYSTATVENGKLMDDGPLKIDGVVKPGVEVSPDGRSGPCLHFTGQSPGFVEVDSPKLSSLIESPLTVSIWVKPEKFPQGASMVILTKRVEVWQSCPFRISLDGYGQLSVEAENGVQQVGGVVGRLTLNQWTHIALTHAVDQDVIVYLDGKEVKRFPLKGTLNSVDEPLRIGYEAGAGAEQRVPFQGWISDLQIYAAALPPDEIGQLAAGQAIPVRAAVASDVAPSVLPVTITLARFDLPLGFKNRDAGEPELTRMVAKRVPGPDAVDWATMFLGDRQLFQAGPQETVVVARKRHEAFGPLFQQPDDNVMTPGNHWFRGVAWLWGRNYAYDVDTSMRAGTAGQLEVWTFPIKITSDKPNSITSVQLTWNGKTLYDYAGPQPLNSLVLLVPQNRPGPPYSLSINGSAPLTFDAGLKPVTLGDPRDEPLPVDLTFPGSPATYAKTLQTPEYNPYQKRWDADLAAMTAPPASPPADVPAPADANSFTRHLGIEVPRAAILTYTAYLEAGMSGGYYFASIHAPDGGWDRGHRFTGTEDDYVKFLRDQNVDMVFERYVPDPKIPKPDSRSADRFVDACDRYGIRAGFNIPTLANPNLAYYSCALPDFWLPKLRDIQLIAQHMQEHPSIIGYLLGTDDAGYSPYWDWSPPFPCHPWADVFLAIHGTNQSPHHPVGPGCAPAVENPNNPDVVRVTEKEFLDYVASYDKTFEQYGRFNDKLTEVDPKLILATSAFGSAPGILGDGGWPVSIPAQPIFKGLPVLQSYDWDETEMERPVHNLALMDVLQSYFPDKPIWALVDNFFLKLNRQAQQRTFAVVLTRGPAAVGHNWEPQPSGPDARPERCADEKEVYGWIHRYSGAYAGTKPEVPIGILYVHNQAVSRSVLPAGTDRDSPAFLTGSHEGKTTEALFLCNAAGWPGRIITPEELKRGLPPEMKTILLTGLNRFDNTWLWSDGLTDALKAFVAGGGRLLTDDETVMPEGVSSIQTGMKIYAYTKEGGHTDPIVRLMTRNQDNIAKLRQVMASTPPPLASSSDSAVWAIPHRTGDIHYITATNWSTEPGKPLAQFYHPYVGQLAWHTSGPIYDVTLSRKLTPQEAATCDFSEDAVRLYACPPGEVQAPQVTLQPGADNFLEAGVTVMAGAKAASGVPLEITVAANGEQATIYRATGDPIRLPVRLSDASGTYTVTVRELLGGQTGSAKYDLKTVAAAPKLSDDESLNAASLKRFLARKAVPLTIALTPKQASDAAYQDLAKKLGDLLASAGRPSRILTISPDQLVTGIQPYTAVQMRPQWTTLPTDLILLGNSHSNLLIYDESLGKILPGIDNLPPGKGQIRLTYSPFVGNYDCLNLIGDSTDAIQTCLTKF